MDYYITFRNQGKPERTPVLPDAENNSRHNINLLKSQGATAIRLHKVMTELSAIQFRNGEMFL